MKFITVNETVNGSTQRWIINTKWIISVTRNYNENDVLDYMQQSKLRIYVDNHQHLIYTMESTEDIEKMLAKYIIKL